MTIQTTRYTRWELHQARQRVGAVLERLARGGMVIVQDDEDRENEGDFIAPAQDISYADLNTMVHRGAGLVCVALGPEIIRGLQLGPQTAGPLPDAATEYSDLPTPGDAQGTAFTVSVDAAQGITTGISIADRLRTLRVLSDPASTPGDLRRPGHIFPLAARSGGLVQRRGHTEAAVELCRAAGRRSAGVICEILNPDGTMARAGDLQSLASELAMPLCSIQDIVIALALESP
ncbi:3,4-dihydroxy-2-butanone-4-phosphate synthase [Spirochaeta lutea]|uniref:3,4-dihydroxy-2-butanone-4-phosphate synthase n=1 Tax=Spirochaeta lutea TaxID=1480694 RepID=UPI00068A92CA|nr:3,4-dihydroxy-2-butanone-4-phosphate synthase [Spirochaeta lutea]